MFELAGKIDSQLCELKYPDPRSPSTATDNFWGRLLLSQKIDYISNVVRSSSSLRIVVLFIFRWFYEWLCTNRRGSGRGRCMSTGSDHCWAVWLYSVSPRPSDKSFCPTVEVASHQSFSAWMQQHLSCHYSGCYNITSLLTLSSTMVSDGYITKCSVPSRSNLHF